MGRPLGSKDSKPRNTAARKWAEELASEGMSPLEGLMMAAEEAFEDWQAKPRDSDARTACRTQFVAIMEKAAPYKHAKLAASTVALSGTDGGPVEIEVIRRVIVDAGHSDAEGVRAPS